MGGSKDNFHEIKKGLDIPLLGEPEQTVVDGGGVTAVAVLADDYVGMRPRMRVQVGDRVVRGQRLFEDRKNPGIFHTAPGAGVVRSINRGERRALRSVIIDIDEAMEREGQENYQAFESIDPDGATSADVRALLLESGLWTSLRARPYGKVPGPESTARALFVTAIDTQPLAPRVETVLEGKTDDFETGLAHLVTLMDGGPVHLCVKDGSSIAGTEVSGVSVQRFAGPHPAGNPGLHIHLIEPVDRERTAWHMGYQDVVAVGHLMRTGKIMVDRVVALSGPGVLKPRLVNTRIGASVSQLLEGELGEGSLRTITGSVLAGRIAHGDDAGFLGRYHNQVTVLEDGGDRKFLGWMGPGFSSYSTSRLFVSSFLPGKKRGLSTLLHGGERTMIPSGALDGVMPFEVMPNFLFKSLLSGDVERAEALGCLELEEEDVALCTFVCSSKIDYGEALRKVLEQIEKEG